MKPTKIPQIVVCCCGAAFANDIISLANHQLQGTRPINLAMLNGVGRASG